MAKSRSTSQSSTSDKKRSNSSSNRILLVIFILVFGYGFISLLRQEASNAESNVLFSDRILFDGDYLKEYNFNLEGDNYFVYDPLVNNYYLDYYDYEIGLQIDGVLTKNLAMPDLTGKTEISAGVYRFHNANGITIDYEVNTGIFTINGTKTSNFSYIFTNFIPIGQYTLSYHYVSGSITSGTLYLANSGEWNIFMINSQYNYTETKQTSNTQTVQTRLYFDFGNSDSFNQYKFKLQLEKGTTATPYEVPYTISTFNIWESVAILLPEVDNFNIRLAVVGNNPVDMMIDYSIQKDYVKPLVHGSNLEIKHNYSDVNQMKSWGSTIMGQQRLSYIVSAIDVLANTMDFLYNTLFTVIDALLNFFDFIIYNMKDVADTIFNLDFKNWWNNFIDSFREVPRTIKPNWR